MRITNVPSRNGDAARAETGTQLESITSYVPIPTSRPPDKYLMVLSDKFRGHHP